MLSCINEPRHLNYVLHLVLIIVPHLLPLDVGDECDYMFMFKLF
jgi:hypothetical protein